ncbi:hypothetical protein CC77DRAFT_720833 [Alternaria alternata]|uniref:Uncharacterized protein n=1 Tax=Alternaria alternata TaxID=5599 RepID=A0A177DWA4_ALTAL|nr:hypothetical protein CC77DRAFT_720833 [Alternaria alternata]OAG23470.1 hypothetical protein CC77DRAFT_720833 [Alternaria alternata]
MSRLLQVCPQQQSASRQHSPRFCHLLNLQPLQHQRAVLLPQVQCRHHLPQLQVGHPLHLLLPAQSQFLAARHHLHQAWQHHLVANRHCHLVHRHLPSPPRPPRLHLPNHQRSLNHRPSSNLLPRWKHPLLPLNPQSSYQAARLRARLPLRKAAHLFLRVQCLSTLEVVRCQQGISQVYSSELRALVWDCSNRLVGKRRTSKYFSMFDV